MAYHLYRNGKFYIDDKEGRITQLEGCFSFINEIDKYNNKFDGNANKKIFRFSSREKEFQKFLFYKYFYANEKSLQFFSNYEEKKVYCNYFEYFNKISNIEQKNPVILIFDNELNTKGKLLYTFSKDCDLSFRYQIILMKLFANSETK